MTDENLIPRPGTNGYVSKLPAICPYGRPKASLLPKIFCLRKHVSSFADCFTGMVSFFVVYWLLPYSCGETECGKEENFFIDHIPVFPTYIDARKYKKRTEMFQQGNIWRSFLLSLTWFDLCQKIFAESNAFCRPSEQMRRSLLKNHLRMGGI